MLSTEALFVRHFCAANKGESLREHFDQWVLLSFSYNRSRNNAFLLFGPLPATFQYPVFLIPGFYYNRKMLSNNKE